MVWCENELSLVFFFYGARNVRYSKRGRSTHGEYLCWFDFGFDLIIYVEGVSLTCRLESYYFTHLTPFFELRALIDRHHVFRLFFFFLLYFLQFVSMVSASPRVRLVQS